MVRRRGRYEEEYESQDISSDENEDNKIPLNIPPKYRTIKVEKFDITVRELWESYANNNLILQPRFQRNYIWDPTRASRYIESLILGLPTPPIFIAEETNGQWTVIDGHQRLASLFRFMKPLFTGPAQIAGVAIPWVSLAPLMLVNLEIITELHGQGVTAIKDSDRDTLLWKAKIPIVKLLKDSHEEMRYALFARLNQGSLSLNNQELRHCLYRGLYNNLITQLSDDPEYLSLWDKNLSDKRMNDRERVLRFFAFLHRMNEYSPPLREFLNKEMKEYQNASEQQLSSFRSEFIGAIVWVDRIFGDKAFKQYKMGDENKNEGHWVRNRYDLIYDVETVGFAHFERQLSAFWEPAGSYERDLLKRILLNRLVNVMCRDTFVASISEGTTRLTAVKSRSDPWLHTLEYVTKDFERALDESKSLLTSRLAANNICSYCGTRVPEEETTLFSVSGKSEISHIYCHRVAERK